MVSYHSSDPASFLFHTQWNTHSWMPIRPGMLFFRWKTLLGESVLKPVESCYTWNSTLRKTRLLAKAYLCVSVK